MLTSGRDDVALISEKLQFAHKIPMYPSTDPGGYAYVVPAEFVYDLTQGKPEVLLSLNRLSISLLTINRSKLHDRIHGKKPTSCSFLGSDVKCELYRWRCRGIRICEKARPEFREFLDKPHTRRLGAASTVALES